MAKKMLSMAKTVAAFLAGAIALQHSAMLFVILLCILFEYLLLEMGISFAGRRSWSRKTRVLFMVFYSLVSITFMKLCGSFLLLITNELIVRTKGTGFLL